MALPTAYRFAKQKAALPNLGAKDPAPWRRRLCQNLEVAAIVELCLLLRDASGPWQVEAARTAAVVSATWSTHLLDSQIGLSKDP